jgi:N-acetyl-alpha-D-muramate 1-phosphate uridylyltransferase
MVSVASTAFVRHLISELLLSAAPLSNAHSSMPSHAFVLAAGLGTRMRPITLTMPKPLVVISGRSMLDHALDRLAHAGVSQAVVNVHYLADQIEAHVASRKLPAIQISDERTTLLETGGGIAKALPLLGHQPFLLMNSDSLWIDGPKDNLQRLADAWDPKRMDALLLLAATTASLGYDGRGDFLMDKQGVLTRRPAKTVAPFVYAGVAILCHSLFANAPEGAFSLNVQFDKALAAGRLYGVRLDGHWLHVGTPEAIGQAEAAIAASDR